MAGWDEEVFWSLLQVAGLKEILKKDSSEILESYQKAYVFRPSRAESLYRIACYQRKLGNYVAAYQAACLGMRLKESQDILFVEKWIYEYGLLLEFSIAAYWNDKFFEALLASKLLLSDSSIPKNVKDCVEKNLVWIDMKLKESNQEDSLLPRL